MTRQRRRTLEKALTPYRKTPGTKSKKRERPLVFEVDLNQAITDLFSTKRQTVNRSIGFLKMTNLLIYIERHSLSDGFQCLLDVIMRNHPPFKKRQITPKSMEYIVQAFIFCLIL